MPRFFILLPLMNLLTLNIALADVTETKIHGLHKSHVGYALMDLDTGKIVKSHQPEKEMILASVSKIFTYYFALTVLGPEYRFKTDLYYTGEIKDGVLSGDLILKGGGDPYLNANHLLSFALNVKAKGISKITGKLIVDGSFLQQSESVSILGLTDQADNPSISGLNVEFNRYDIWYKEMLAYPPVDSIILKPKKSSNYGLRFDHLKMDDHKEIWRVNTREYIPAVDSIPSKNSSLFFGNYFRLLAKRLQIELPAPEEGKLQGKTNLIYSYESIPFFRIAELGLEFSNNLMAETALMTAARKINSLPQDSRISAETMLKWYKKQFPEIDWDKVTLINGSGLTVNNFISPALMTQFLRALSKQTIEGRSYMSYLSINGHNGGIRRRLPHPSLGFHLYGKTGSLYFVNNLAGYLIGKSGKMYAYAFLTTHLDHRDVLSGEDSKQKKYLRRKSGEWNKLSSEAMDTILEEWIREL